MTHLTQIAQFIFESFLHIWPYLLITIPLAVGVKHSKASVYIKSAMTRKPVVAILLATVVGAFSPFCSCGVIPVITSLLIGGVPLAPVMSFWIASPSMDPEIFFLSAGTIGLELSVWRLCATFMISLGAGFMVHYLTKTGFLGTELLRTGIAKMKPARVISTPKGNITVCCEAEVKLNDMIPDSLNITDQATQCSSKGASKSRSVKGVLLKDSLDATWLVIKFMGLAFLINALIKFYVPAGFIDSLLGGEGPFSLIIATLVGIPAYTSNITALPLVEGLLSIGMDKGAALAFLIAGPVTTLPAMAAVWGITTRKVFFLYIFFSLSGALLTGITFNLLN